MYLRLNLTILGQTILQGPYFNLKRSETFFLGQTLSFLGLDYFSEAKCLPYKVWKNFWGHILPFLNMFLRPNFPLKMPEIFFPGLTFRFLDLEYVLRSNLILSASKIVFWGETLPYLGLEYFSEAKLQPYKVQTFFFDAKPWAYILKLFSEAKPYPPWVENILMRPNWTFSVPNSIPLQSKTNVQSQMQMFQSFEPFHHEKPFSHFYTIRPLISWHWSHINDHNPRFGLFSVSHR